MCVSCLAFGSQSARCRPALAIGNSFAEGWLDPSLQKLGFSGGRTVDVIQTRPCPSNIGLWTLFLLSQMASSPQYGDGAGIVAGDAGLVFGSRTDNSTSVATLRTGSSTGR